MTLSRVYELLRELKCAMALEIAERLGISRKAVQAHLNRLAAKGLVERRTLGRRAVIYCVRGDGGRGDSRKPGDSPASTGRRRARRGGLYTKTRERAERVLEILQRNGCVSVGVLMRMLRITHAKAYHVLRIVLLMHQGAKMIIGRTAVLCRDRAATEETISQLRDAIHRIVVQSGMRYVTAAKVLQAVLKGRATFELFSRFIPLRRGMSRFPPVVLTFINDILRSLYGEPLKAGNKRVYVVAQQPRAGHGFDIIDSVDRQTVAVNIPEDLAAALEGADVNEMALQALEQLLTRYRP